MATKQGECIGCEAVREVNQFDVCLECSTSETVRLGRRLEEVRNALVAQKADATPSRGQIATRVMAGFAACRAEFPGIKEVAEVSVEWADALLDELTKSRAQASRERVARALARELSLAAKPTEAKR